MDAVKPIDVTDSAFEDLVLDSDKPVVLEFWSPLCVHCQKMAHVVDALAEEMAGKVVVAKVNILENTDTPPKYGVTGIPAFFLIKGGEVVAKTLGAMPKGRLKKDLGL